MKVRVAVDAVLGRVRHIVRRHNRSNVVTNSGWRVAVGGVVVQDLDIGRGEGRLQRSGLRIDRAVEGDLEAGGLGCDSVDRERPALEDSPVRADTSS